MNLTQTEKKVVEKIQEQELVELATGLGNVTAPSGYEQPLADHVEDWLRKNGFYCYQQNLCEGRSNAIGILKGKGQERRSSSTAIWIPTWGYPLSRAVRFRPTQGSDRGEANIRQPRAERPRSDGCVHDRGEGHKRR